MDNPKQTPVPAQYVFSDSQHVPFPIQNDIVSLIMVSTQIFSLFIVITAFQAPLLSVRQEQRLFLEEIAVKLPHWNNDRQEEPKGIL